MDCLNNTVNTRLGSFNTPPKAHQKQKEQCKKPLEKGGTNMLVPQAMALALGNLVSSNFGLACFMSGAQDWYAV